MKDNLPIYLMHTMLRIRTEEDFYPALDVRALYKLIQPKTYGLEQLNPDLFGLIGGDDETIDEMGEDGVSSVRNFLFVNLRFLHKIVTYHLMPIYKYSSIFFFDFSLFNSIFFSFYLRML